MLRRRSHSKSATKPTPEIIARVAELAAQKLTQAEIAIDVGASTSGVQRWMKLNGIAAMTPVEGRAAFRSRWG